MSLGWTRHDTPTDTGMIERNDALLESSAFRDFLAAVANRAGYMDGTFGLPEAERTRREALRDIVNGVIRNSSKGSEWLREYAESKANKTISPKTEDTQDA